MKEPFPIERLIKKKEDRGLMAHLAKWWSPRTRHYAYPVIGKIFGGFSIGDLSVEIPAALFAIHPLHSTDNGNIGDTCRRIAGKDLETYEAHFRRLLASQKVEDDLEHQLFRIGKRARAEGIPINFVQLSDDLRLWKWKQDRIKIDWAKSFWSTIQAEKLEIPES